MRVGYAGTPEFARVALAAISQAGWRPAVVLTQPDRPAGRGLQLTPSPVKTWATEHGIPVLQPRSLRLDGRYPEDAEAARQALQDLAIDVLVVAAYGLILPRWVLELPRHGCLNIHASLLPRWRGAAPIHRAIEAGDTETGICIMQMDEGLDTGPVVRRASLAIGEHETTGELQDRLALLGGHEIVAALTDLQAFGSLPAVPQATEGISYAAKVDKAEARPDWSLPAIVLERRIRAFNPAPGVTLPCGPWGELKIWRARTLPSTSTDLPGTLAGRGEQGWLITTGEGLLELIEVQKPGGRRQPAALLPHA
jgi:methionyl-tRNA formyltransferase